MMLDGIDSEIDFRLSSHRRQTSDSFRAEERYLAIVLALKDR